MIFSLEQASFFAFFQASGGKLKTSAERESRATGGQKRSELASRLPPLASKMQKNNILNK